MKIFKELNKLGYKHYTEHTIEELDNLPLDSEERIMEQALVFKWFREKYGLVGIIVDLRMLRPDYYYEANECDFQCSISELGKYSAIARSGNHKTLEEAALVCLGNLIEIVNKTKYSSINAPTYYN
jgi:hypothetical protein